MSIRSICWLSLVVALAACSGQQAPETPTASRPVVGVTNYPLQYFVERIAGPLVEVRSPAAAEPDPAAWRPTPEEVIALQQADLVVLNGASYESWLDRVALPETRIVDTSAGFRDRLVALHDVVTHSHGLEGKHAHSGTAFTTWLDPNLAIEQARAAKDALTARWPQHAAQFEAGFAALAQKLGELDRQIEAIVAADPERPVVFSHPVYQYLEARYRINGRSVHWEPGEMPDEAQWRQLATMLEGHPASWMIWEDAPLQAVALRLAGFGLSSAVFAPCGGMPADGDFVQVMHSNIAELGRVYRVDRPH